MLQILIDLMFLKSVRGQSALLGIGAKQAIVGQYCPLLGGTTALCNDSKGELTADFPFHSDVGCFAFATGKSDAVLAALRKFSFNA